jgi:hypothetical protein
MYKKISNYVCIVSLISSFFGVTFGMERDHTLMQLMRKDIIPVLALNDYLAPVSNAYQALKKEASMPYASIETMHHRVVKKANRIMRELLIEGSGCLYKVYTEKASDKEKRNRMLSYYRAIQFTCLSPSEGACKMGMHMCISTFLYRASHSSCKTHLYSKQEAIKKDINIFLKDIISRIVPKGQFICIEIRCPHKISDWIMIDNSFKADDQTISNESLQENSIVGQEK